jgi:hypothetical protein
LGAPAQPSTASHQAVGKWQAERKLMEGGSGSVFWNSENRLVIGRVSITHKKKTVLPTAGTLLLDSFYMSPMFMFCKENTSLRHQNVSMYPLSQALKKDNCPEQLLRINIRYYYIFKKYQLFY